MNKAFIQDEVCTFGVWPCIQCINTNNNSILCINTIKLNVFNIHIITGRHFFPLSPLLFSRFYRGKCFKVIKMDSFIWLKRCVWSYLLLVHLGDRAQIEKRIFIYPKLWYLLTFYRVVCRTKIRFQLINSVINNMQVIKWNRMFALKQTIKISQYKMELIFFGCFEKFMHWIVSLCLNWKIIPQIFAYFINKLMISNSCMF